MERSPPPLFNQGPSARVRLMFFAGLSLVLLLVDARFQVLSLVRQSVGTVLYPFQQAALWPRDAMRSFNTHFGAQTALQRENQELRAEQLANAQALQSAQQFATENTQLKKLLELEPHQSLKSVVARILYDARDPFTRKVVIDRGVQHGVQRGQPVIDATGVIGQVVRVFPLTAEIALLTDKDQTIPVQVVRNGLRAVAFGGPKPSGLELRFIPANADLQNGDVLVTSGLDGLYPPGLQVARIERVERLSNSAFARVYAEPLGGVDKQNYLLVLLWQNALPAAPEPAPVVGAQRHKPGAKP